MIAAKAEPAKRMGLDTIISVRTAQPLRIVCIGQPGAGKTRFGAGAESPALIPVEDGANELDVPRFPVPESLADVRAALVELLNATHTYKTLVIDGTDVLESLIWKHVCAESGVSTIEKVGGGFGKGYTAALDEWRAVLAMCDELRRKRGMHIIIIGHTMIRPFNDPSLSEPYDRFEMRLHKGAAGLLSQWSDIVAFAIHDDVVQAGERKAIGTGKRILRVHHTPAMDAKNRFNINEDLPLSWTALMNAIRDNGPEAALAIRTEIETWIPKLNESKRAAAKSFLDKAGNDVAQLKLALATAKGAATKETKQ